MTFPDASAFVVTWQHASSVAAVAKQLSLDKADVRDISRYLRGLGVRLKCFKPGSKCFHRRQLTAENIADLAILARRELAAAEADAVRQRVREAG